MARSLPALRTCLACYELKPAGKFSSPRARKCADCYAKDARRRRPCLRCGKETPLADFIPYGHLCSECRATPCRSRVERAKRSCVRCFIVKPAEQFAWGDGRRGRGTYRRRRGICLECEAKEQREKAEAAEQRRATWERDGVLVRRCSLCRDIKPLEVGFYVTEPRAETLRRWSYRCKKCDHKRAAAVKRRMLASPETRARHAQWKREWAKRNPERYKAAQKRYADKVKADPERYARFLETGRIAYRLRKERREGIDLDDVRVQRPQHPFPRDIFPRLPAAPLGRAVEDVIDIETRDGRETARESVCARAGIPPRTLHAWNTGERRLVQFAVADRVITRLDLQWWDIWDEADPVARGVWEGSVAA